MNECECFSRIAQIDTDEYRCASEDFSQLVPLLHGVSRRRHGGTLRIDRGIYDVLFLCAAPCLPLHFILCNYPTRLNPQDGLRVTVQASFLYEL